MNEEEILLNYLKDENWKYFHEDGIPYKTIFIQDRDILIKYITKLQNNWNELKEYAKENLYFYSGLQGEDREEDTSIKDILEKMQEMENSKDDKNI